METKDILWLSLLKNSTSFKIFYIFTYYLDMLVPHLYSHILLIFISLYKEYLIDSFRVYLFSLLFICMSYKTSQFVNFCFVLFALYVIFGWKEILKFSNSSICFFMTCTFFYFYILGSWMPLPPSTTPSLSFPSGYKCILSFPPEKFEQSACHI